MSVRSLIATAGLAAVLALPAAAMATTPAVLPAGAAPGDAFIAGYAAAVLEREFSVKVDGLTVTDGHVVIASAELSPAEAAQVVKALSTIAGVKDVTVTRQGAPRTTAAVKPLERITVGGAPAAATRPAAAASPDEQAASDATHLHTDDTPLTLYLGVGRTFQPLLADPRWPHFYASYHNYDVDREPSTRLDYVASVGFGETISLIKQSYASGFRWEAGVQGALFAIFDMGSDSKDLINADYFVGPYFAARQGDFSILARVYHQSSHLGDEYLLRSDAEPRVNYSFETVNVLLSYDLPQGFRVYGGGGYLFDVDPSSTDPLTVEYGVEWISPSTIPGVSWLRPVAAFDGQNRQNNDWAFSYSLRAGVQIEDPARYNQRLQIMLEYYDGNSPDGQFYYDHIRYFGIGAHFYF